MKKEEIFLGDWQRILIGHAPAEFMLEVLIRTIIIYLILLVVLRLLGKRMNAQLSITEMAVMITLGAIVAVPMQAPDRGLLPALVILLCALAFQQGLNLLSYHKRKVEVLTQGDVSMVVKNGVLQLKDMHDARITHQQLFSSLRNHGVRHLGEVERAYMEACGLFSVFKTDQPRPGLSVKPETDTELKPNEVSPEDALVCTTCGKLSENPLQPQPACSNCNSFTWAPAIC